MQSTPKAPPKPTPLPAPDPPRRNRPALYISIAALVVWMIYLAWLAFRE